MPYTVVIADDITGANDIGIMYAKEGLSVHVYSYKEGEKTDYAPCDVLILDTDSRFDTKERAYEKVRGALEQIPKEGVVQYIDKQCSVFRGNIGAEFDAMMDFLQVDFAVVVLGFPDNGRTTVEGKHYVHGVLLEESQFRHDPVHPMLESDLTKILEGQTSRNVGHISSDRYADGEGAVREALDEIKKTCHYCIMDVRDNADLELLANVLQSEKMICGSSALSRYLGKIYASKGQKGVPAPSQKVRAKVYCAAGSLTPQTVHQTAYMREKGCCLLELDTRKLFTDRERQQETARVISLGKKVFLEHDFLMVHSMHDRRLVEETKKIAAEYGYDNTEASSVVSSVLAEISCRLIEAAGIRHVIFCGGDTSAAICKALGIRGMEVLDEIEAGLPTCRSLEAPFYKMVLKSGSFGSEAFLEKSIDKLLLEKEQEDGCFGTSGEAD